ncbi:L-histidine N(alpha)-methyltransferase [Edaphobacter albus]|uniref:L-histidine N(alpha)-methyltransferase n=1 Tax=Edaphobacter sp. 4G125 TaxID=2763071 RepID=UPI0016451C48|nr:L-histidine N(alpha)-methyltransferase [Edaphobacter sp. 4G125]QNI38453.1 L-histidine N(alpha)-methyltransferase [Edaphobacter sp. 4G125]
MLPAATDPLSLSTSLCTLSPIDAVAAEARSGLLSAPKTLSPWLFYDENGSRLFEQITELPEYYLTRTERGIFHAYADEMIALASEPTGSDPAPILTLIELGAGTATKTGILLRAAVRRQKTVVYQPVDVSETALAEATENIRGQIPGVTVRCQVADYTTQPLPLNRLPNTRTLALYIGSSIGNFSPEQARDVLWNLRSQLLPGDKLLLGTDLVPGNFKSIADLIAAYDDASGVTAAFNRNVLARLNRELGANFHSETFEHQARWNASESRIEMHLVSSRAQQIHIPANSSGPSFTLGFARGESIHTENSYKFTPERTQRLLQSAGFALDRTWKDEQQLFAVNLATAI